MRSNQTAAIPLFSGIGNVIQSMPFIYEMRQRYKGVVGFIKDLDFLEAVGLVSDLLDMVHGSHGLVLAGCKVFKTPRRISYPEALGWFRDNDEEPPEKLTMPEPRYAPREEKHQVVIWPECKKNWICKQWPYFEQLAREFGDAAIIGTGTEGDYRWSTDYRGKLSLLETGGIIKNAGFFIGNEGGMAHYAAALGVRTYVIMGASDPVKNLPPFNAIPISLNLPCQPCQYTTMKMKGIQMLGCDSRRCLNDLTVDEVLAMIL